MRANLLYPLLSVRESADLVAQYETPKMLLHSARHRLRNAGDASLLLDRLADALETVEALIEASICDPDVTMSSPQAAREYLVTHMAGRVDEIFTVLYLDSQNRLVSVRDEFTGTVSQTAVFPRVIIRHALMFNASAIVLAHNHPSGFNGPSQADQLLTSVIASVCNPVDIRVLDHIIVAHKDTFSFAENGLI